MLALLFLLNGILIVILIPLLLYIALHILNLILNIVVLEVVVIRLSSRSIITSWFHWSDAIIKNGSELLLIVYGLILSSWGPNDCRRCLFWLSLSGNHRSTVSLVEIRSSGFRSQVGLRLKPIFLHVWLIQWNCRIRESLLVRIIPLRLSYRNWNLLSLRHELEVVILLSSIHIPLSAVNCL
jgi:hypothetical protein